MGAIVAIAVAAFFGRDLIFQVLLEGIVRIATGYTLSIGKVQLGSSHGVLFDVHVRRGGDPVLDAQRIVMVDGRHLPQSIALTPKAAGVELVGATP